MVEKNLYNALDGVAGRDGGPYLDQVEARKAEEVRARIEGRQPDYTNPPATAGQPLVTAEQLLRLQGTSNIPSQENNNVQAEALDKFAKDDIFPINPHSVRESTNDEDIAVEAEAVENRPQVPANPTAASENPGGIADGDPFPTLTETTDTPTTLEGDQTSSESNV
jgi:hypothetical protein